MPRKSLVRTQYSAPHCIPGCGTTPLCSHMQDETPTRLYLTFYNTAWTKVAFLVGLILVSYAFSSADSSSSSHYSLVRRSDTACCSCAECPLPSFSPHLGRANTRTHSPCAAHVQPHRSSQPTSQPANHDGIIRLVFVGPQSASVVEVGHVEDDCGSPLPPLLRLPSFAIDIRSTRLHLHHPYQTVWDQLQHPTRSGLGSRSVQKSFPNRVRIVLAQTSY